MGWFSRRQRPTIEFGPVRRTIYLPASPDAIASSLGEYSGLSPRPALTFGFTVATSGAWTRLETETPMHPWAFHNVAFWLADIPGCAEAIVLESDAGPTWPSYRLVLDPEIADCLCGNDEFGQGWTVAVPDNAIVRPEAVPRVASAPGAGAWTPAGTVQVSVEDPQHDLNPTNESTFVSRKRLQGRHRGASIAF